MHRAFYMTTLRNEDLHGLKLIALLVQKRSGETIVSKKPGHFDYSRRHPEKKKR